jgi:DNA polymerase sigma
VVKTTRRKDQPFFNAYIGLSFLEYMNLGSIFAVVNYFLKYRVSKDASIYGTLILFALILLCNYFSLWVKKEAIVSRYDSLPIKNGKILVWIFIILSFSIFFIVLNYFVVYS